MGIDVDWEATNNFTSDIPLVQSVVSNSGRPPPFRYPVAPPQLFTGALSENKKVINFYVWLAIRRHYIRRLKEEGFEQNHLHQSASQWRSILSADYFKKKCPEANKDFKRERFWEHGARELLSRPICLFDPSTDLTPRFSDGTPLVFNNIDNNLRHLIAWDNGLLYLQTTLVATNIAFSRDLHDDEKKQRLERMDSLFHSLDDMHLVMETPPWANSDLKIQISWYTQFRDIVKDWPPWDTWAANKAKDTDLHDLNEDLRDAYYFKIRLVYAQSVFSVLGLVLPLIPAVPTFAGSELYSTL